MPPGLCPARMGLSAGRVVGSTTKAAKSRAGFAGDLIKREPIHRQHRRGQAEDEEVQPEGYWHFDRAMESMDWVRGSLLGAR